jgi:BspA type Leucine rich repeat region (6 copies)
MKNCFIISVLVVVFVFTACLTTPGKDNKSNKVYKVEGGVILRYLGEDEVHVIIPEILSGETITTLKGKVFINKETIQTISIPSGITDIGPEVFLGCENLLSFTVAGDNPAFTVVDDVLFSKDKTSLIVYPQGKQYKEYTVPQGVVNISENAFKKKGTDHLEKVVLPESLTSIEAGLFQGQGDLREIIVDKDNPAYLSLDGVLFSKDKKIIIKYPSGKTGLHYTVPEGVVRMEDDSFSMLLSTDKITLPDSLEIIGDRTFSTSFLKDVNIPINTKIIGRGAFAGCVKLKVPVFPDSLLEIGRMAFYACFTYRTLYLPKNIESIGRWAFSFGEIKNIKSGAVDKPAGWHKEWTDAQVQWGVSP